MAQGSNRSLKLNMVLNGIKGLMGILFPLISFPYVSRVLGVDGLGKYNFAASVVSYITLLAALGFATYAIREGACIRDSKERFSKFSSEIYSLNMISTCVAYCVLAVLLCTVPKFSDYRAIIIILSISVFVQTFGCEWIYSVYEEYTYITIRSILLQVASILLLFLFVKTPDDLNVYAWISVLAGITASVLNRILGRKYGRIRLTASIDWKRHVKPIMVLFAMNAAVTLYVSSDITLLGILRDDYTVGIYSVSVKVYNMIKTVLSAVVVVSIPRLSSLLGKNEREEFNRTASDIYRTLITVVFPTIVGIMLMSKEIVLLISDAAYLEAVPSLIILAATLFFCLGAGFWGQAILIPVKKENAVLKATIISALVNVGLNIVLIPLWGEVAAALTTLISEMLAFILCAHAAKKDVKLSGVGKTVLKCAIGCLVMSGYVFFIKTLELDMLVNVVVSMVGAVVIYFAVELLLKNETVYDLVKNVRRRGISK